MADTEIFQHYQVLKHPDGSLWELGRGAMGVTYKAFDTSLRCPVALKVINAAFLDSDMARQRFLREARAAAGLSHSNVASVFHLGEEGGNYFYAMEFINGETLEAFVRRRGPLPPALALKITLQVARALRAASREGLVHRDIKPANLMLVREDDEEGDTADPDIQVKVIDFGLAKATRKDGADSSATITVAGFVGTPHFASPEQLEEKTLDARSDIYSLGVTLWYMLAGRPPFSGSMVQIMNQHLTRKPAFEQLPDLPVEVVQLVEHMLEKDPAKRPQTAAELRREIEAAALALSDGRDATPARASGRSPAATDPGASPESTFPTQALPDGASLDSANHASPGGEVATGTVLAGHYRLLRTVAQSAHGTLFQALELDQGNPVALKVLSPTLLATPEAFQRADLAVTQTRSALHPSLLELYALERGANRVFLACEWVNGFTLMELLRHRQSLTLDEALRCLEPLAAASDHAKQAGLRELDFSPAQVLLAFEATLDLPAQSLLIGQPLDQWPAFRPKVYPLSVAALDIAPEPTWSGLQTMVPGVGSVMGATRQLALLASDLLGGSSAPYSSTQTRPPLPMLTERGNTVLRQGLSAAQPPVFAKASDLIAALRESNGDGRRPTLAPRIITPVSAATGSANTATTAPSPLPLATWPIPSAQGTALPPFVQVVPAPTSLAKATSPTTPSRSPLVFLLLLLVSLIILGVLGGAFYAAWKIYDLAGARATPVKAAERHHTTPAILPTATPPPAPSDPPRPATPTPAVAQDPASRAREMLAEGDALDRNGDAVGALNLYTRVAADYPTSDPGLSRLDSFIARLRNRPADDENEPRRLSAIRLPMEEAAHLGSDAAMLYLGDHLAATDPSAAVEWYRQAAEKGQPDAMVALGDLYFRGVGVPLEPSQAARWYQLASDKGFPKAKVYLAECYELGKAGLARNYDKAFQLLNEALALDPNNAQATEKLAEEYERGRGTAPDAYRAFGLMKRAVDLGSTAAIGNLGVYYMKGVGQQADPRMAAALFKQGMAKQNPPCTFFYAQCVEKGLGGVTANPSEAVGYYQAAAERGFPPARDWCNQHHVSFVPANKPVPP